jgi:ABC-type nitrate/sulfonate/bicarbonate transport system substrate-binding protein
MGKGKVAVLASVLLLVVIAAYLWQVEFRSRKADLPPGPLEKITISTLPIYTPGLLFIAQEKGYFKENGLDVTIKFFQTGQIGMEQVRAGQVDIAHVGDFVLVDAILKGAKSLRCLGSIVAAEINHIMALKDRGISQPTDLKGKKVGVTHGTIAEFFLGRFLTFNNLSLNDVKIIYLTPSEMSEALDRNQVDAVMVWDPTTYEIKKRLCDRIINWPGQTGQKFYNVLVSTAEFTQNRSKTLEALFRALVQAETFIKNNRYESIDIIAKQINLDKSVFQSDWLSSNYELSFDQSLLIAMEDEARWIIRNKLTDQTTLPDFLDYLEAEPLARAIPKAVKIIIPKEDQRAPAPSGKGPER